MALTEADKQLGFRELIKKLINYNNQGNPAANVIGEVALTNFNTGSVILKHIPSKAIANPVTADSWVTLLGYHTGVIWAQIPATVTGAVELQISYSNDAGVTSTGWTTIYTFAGSTAEDAIVSFVDALERATPSEPPTEYVLKKMPFFKLRLSGGGGTGNVFCEVTLER